jgi:competence protein ComEC
VKLDISVPGRFCLLAGIASWCGVVAGVSSAWFAGLVVLVLLIAVFAIRRAILGVAVGFLILGMASGMATGERAEATQEAVIPTGRVVLEARIAEEVTEATFSRAVGEPRSIDGIRWKGPRLALIGLSSDIPVGATVTVTGDLSPRVARIRDEVVAGVLTIDETLSVQFSRNPIVQIGNAIRERVMQVFDGSRSGDGLVRGLLIGDTSLLAASDEEDLRLAGLAHFVAVSGSNVAMFLVAWWFLTAPIAVRPVLRVVGGMVGLAVFAVVTRWEPSVIRASVMAGVPLLGGLLGLPFDPWMALGTGVTFLLLVSGQLAFSVGFQLSVAATAGVLVGVAVAGGRRPGWLTVPLFATIGAQLAVAPIILVVFGSVPLLAPLTNLVVAPMVAMTTAIGALGIVLPPLASLSDVGATVILTVAQAAAGGPQLGWAGTITAILIGVSVAWNPSRPLGVAAVVLATMMIGSAAPGWPSVPTLVVLDVGQGDAILLLDPSGQTVLVDGGPDPRSLDRALRRHGIRRIDLAVVTHGDLDHVGGMTELLGSGWVSELWVPMFVEESGLLADAIDIGKSNGIPFRRVASGVVWAAPSFRIDVLGPGRKYQADNDGSVTLLVSTGRTVLLGGDIEAVAQSDLPELHPDVMVVPHHGSGTNDLRWLERVVGATAVLSYGENSYGHPHPEVLKVLGRSGAVVLHTYLEGDISVALSPAPGN